MPNTSPSGYGSKPDRQGLIQARAARFVVDPMERDVDRKERDDSEIPREFWWARGEAALEQNWETGDFETWYKNSVFVQAFGVTFRRSDIEKLIADTEPTDNKVSQHHERIDQQKRKPNATGNTVFIGHGRAAIWRGLKDFLEDRLHLSVEEFNSVPVAGMTIVSRLEEMLDNAAFAFLIMTAEDEQPDGKIRARENVVHEAGLFQGRLGFRKAIILLEEGCDKFSNIYGLNHIQFQKNKISSEFEAIRQILKREGLVPLPLNASAEGSSATDRSR